MLQVLLTLGQLLFAVLCTAMAAYMFTHADGRFAWYFLGALNTVAAGLNFWMLVRR